MEEYGKIYAKAFSGEPWNDCWKIEDAILHVSEILESEQSYGWECLSDGNVVGFILGSTMLFHYGRVFEINDLAVLPDYQRNGIELFHFHSHQYNLLFPFKSIPAIKFRKRAFICGNQTVIIHGQNGSTIRIQAWLAGDINWILKNGGIFRARCLGSGREGLIWEVIL